MENLHYCGNSSHTNYSEAGAGGRQWIYQTCTEFGWYQSSNQLGFYLSKILTINSHFHSHFLFQIEVGIFPKHISFSLQKRFPTFYLVEAGIIKK